MRRPLTSLCLTSLIALTSPISAFYPIPTPPVQAATPTDANSDLYYTFYGKKIPLALKPNTIAVSFKSTGGTRDLNARPLHLQLQDALQGTQGNSSSRGLNRRPPTLSAEVKPLGDNYALIQLPAGEGDRNFNAVSDRIKQQSYVETTLPVLARSGSPDGSAGGNAGDKNAQLRDETIVLPNEILISFDPGFSASQIQATLNRYNLEIIRALRFTQNRYLAKSKTATGTAILSVANRLAGIAGIQSATPNFVQSLGFNRQEQLSGDLTSTSANNLLARLPQPDSPITSSLLPQQWHLDSTPQRGSSLPRTDLRATAAWKQGDRGQGVVVAVIDSLIQWDHPDLASRLYTPSHLTNKLPNEEHGWDFSSANGGDADTRISTDELNRLRPDFQNTFQLSTADLLKKYDRFAKAVKSRYPDFSDWEVANFIRNYIRSDIASEFHGTWTAGVILAQPGGSQSTGTQGALGVAPEAQLLPVRVFGLGGATDEGKLIEAIGYSAARGADVINMSLGGLLPSQGLTEQVFSILDANPKLVMVASAGNESLDGVGFPAAIPGVISVGATSLEGRRTFYSSYGGRLDLVAPGGETSQFQRNGILTTGGTGLPGFWTGITPPAQAWRTALDPLGNYVQVQGTSFSSPAVAGVVALMKGADRDRTLDRHQFIAILKRTASYQGLQISKADATQFRLQKEIGFGTAMDFSFLRPSGAFPLPKPISAEQYFFGSGLVNAEAAVLAVKQR